MRFVDDFLLITRDEGVAKGFIAQLHAGVPSYNCIVNREKGGANFTLTESEEVLVDEKGDAN